MEGLNEFYLKRQYSVWHTVGIKYSSYYLPSCPLNICITLDKLFNLIKLSFLTCQMETDNIHFMKFLKGLNEIKLVSNSNS